MRVHNNLATRHKI